MIDDFAAAMEISLKQIGASDRFESELRRALDRFPPAVVDRVVARLKESRVLDDVRTTREALDRNEGRRAVGIYRLREKLLRRGAPEDLLERTLAEAIPRETERARGVLVAKYPEGAFENRARAARFLYSRGFDEETIEAAITDAYGAPTERRALDVFIE